MQICLQEQLNSWKFHKFQDTILNHVLSLLAILQQLSKKGHKVHRLALPIKVKISLRFSFSIPDN